jgi:hypothetical protein
MTKNNDFFLFSPSSSNHLITAKKVAQELGKSSNEKNIEVESFKRNMGSHG